MPHQLPPLPYAMDALQPHISKETLEFMIQRVGTSRVVLGSDYPYDMGMMDCVAHVKSLAISDKDKQSILHDRAIELLTVKA